MGYPTKELKVTMDDFMGPFLDKKLRSLSVKISDELISEFRGRLLEAIKIEISKMDMRSVQDDKRGELKIIIEDKRTL